MNASEVLTKRVRTPVGDSDAWRQGLCNRARPDNTVEVLLDHQVREGGRLTRVVVRQPDECEVIE